MDNSILSFLYRLAHIHKQSGVTPAFLSQYDTISLGHWLFLTLNLISQPYFCIKFDACIAWKLIFSPNWPINGRDLRGMPSLLHMMLSIHQLLMNSLWEIWTEREFAHWIPQENQINILLKVDPLDRVAVQTASLKKQSIFTRRRFFDDFSVWGQWWIGFIFVW